MDVDPTLSMPLEMFTMTKKAKNIGERTIDNIQTEYWEDSTHE